MYESLLDIDIGSESMASEILQLPLRMGGLGIRSAARTRAPASWASWTDCLAMEQPRHPDLANAILLVLTSASDAPLFQELSQIQATLRDEGFNLMPSWAEACDGTRSPRPEHPEPGEFAHGWQYHAATAVEVRHRADRIMPACDPAQQALLRSKAVQVQAKHFFRSHIHNLQPSLLNVSRCC